MRAVLARLLGDGPVLAAWAGDASARAATVATVATVKMIFRMMRSPGVVRIRYRA